MSPLFTLSAVVFDMDGLLLDSEKVAQEVILKAARSVGVPLTPELTLKMVGRNEASCYLYLLELLENEGRVRDLLEKTHQLYASEFEAGRIPLKTGVRELLTILDEFQIPRAIATSTKRQIAIRKLTKVHVLNRFDHILGGDDVEHGKPAPDIYLKACATLGVEPTACIACEDSAFGVEAAFTARLRPVLVPDLLTPTEEMIRQAWRVLPSLHEVAALVRDILTDHMKVPPPVRPKV
jgi:HAD superfamily hydrolase (TIGR01509 family)